MAQYSLVRPWAADPWRDLGQLRREMDALFSRFAGPTTAASPWRGVFPAVNLYETADAYIVTAELPGVSSDDIHVSLEGTTVTLEGERKIDHATAQAASIHRQERQAGSFKRAFQLPAAIEADKVEATHRNGILTLRLPKTPEHQPRQIAVTSG